MQQMTYLFVVVTGMVVRAMRTNDGGCGCQSEIERECFCKKKNSNREVSEIEKERWDKEGEDVPLHCGCRSGGQNN